MYYFLTPSANRAGLEFSVDALRARPSVFNGRCFFHFKHSQLAFTNVLKLQPFLYLSSAQLYRQLSFPQRRTSRLSESFNRDLCLGLPSSPSTTLSLPPPLFAALPSTCIAFFC